MCRPSHVLIKDKTNFFRLLKIVKPTRNVCVCVCVFLPVLVSPLCCGLMSNKLYISFSFALDSFQRYHFCSPTLSGSAWACVWGFWPHLFLLVSSSSFGQQQFHFIAYISLQCRISCLVCVCVLRLINVKNREQKIGSIKQSQWLFCVCKNVSADFVAIFFFVILLHYSANSSRFRAWISQSLLLVLFIH